MNFFYTALVMALDMENLIWQNIRRDFAENGLKENDIVNAVLIKKSPKEAFFDLGKIGTGVVYGLEYMNARDVLGDLKIGDSVPAKVINLDGEGGYIEISLTEGGGHRLWKEVQELEEAGEIIKFKAISSNTGGLVGEIGIGDLKAFLPISQLSNDHYPDYVGGDRSKIAEEIKKLVGKEFNVKIISVNPRNNKLIVSERDTVSVNTKELISKYKVGQIIDGVVSGIADFGVFVKFSDDPKVEGLIHISELDYKSIDHPKEVVKLNEEVKAKIVNIRDGRIFLSIKELKPDPWENVKTKYKEGQEVEGAVQKLNPFGATIDLGDDIQGVIHVSEFGSIEDLKKSLEIGKSYEFVIKIFKPEERRIVLGMKQAK